MIRCKPKPRPDINAHQNEDKILQWNISIRSFKGQESQPCFLILEVRILEI